MIKSWFYIRVCFLLKIITRYVYVVTFWLDYFFIHNTYKCLAVHVIANECVPKTAENTLSLGFIPLAIIVRLLYSGLLRMIPLCLCHQLNI